MVSFSGTPRMSCWGQAELKAAHRDYVSKHPELRTILNDFMAAVLTEKPGARVAAAVFVGLCIPFCWAWPWVWSAAHWGIDLSATGCKPKFVRIVLVCWCLLLLLLCTQSRSSSLPGRCVDAVWLLVSNLALQWA